MEQQIAMMRPVGRQDVVKDQPHDGLCLVDLAKGFGAVAKSVDSGQEAICHNAPGWLPWLLG